MWLEQLKWGVCMRVVKQDWMRYMNHTYVTLEVAIWSNLGGRANPFKLKNSSKLHKVLHGIEQGVT